MDYDSFASDFEAFRKRATTDREIGFANVMRAIDPVKDKYVLDYGCGSGLFAELMFEQGARVAGVDISANLIEAAQRATDPAIEYRLIKSADLSMFPDNTFDAVAINLVLCILSSPDEIGAILREVRRVLRRGGVCVALNTDWEKSNGKEFLSFTLRHEDELVPGKKVFNTLKGPQSITVEEFFWPQAMYRTWFEKAGFGDVEVVEHCATDHANLWINEMTFPPFFTVRGIK